MDETDNQFSWSHWRSEEFKAAYRRMVQQPGDGALARPGNAILNLSNLFCDVDMHRRAARHSNNCRELVRRHRAKAMRSDADNGSGKPGCQAPAALKQ